MAEVDDEFFEPDNTEHMTIAELRQAVKDQADQQGEPLQLPTPSSSTVSFTFRRASCAVTVAPNRVY
ncbi:TPA: hypothetical protein ACH3X2_003789 [Trebouxia sp. C0005]